MFLYLREVGLEHVNDIETVIVVVGSHLFLVVFKIFLYVLEQSETHVREVVDVVHRVEYSVNQSLCESSDGGHSLLAEKLVLCGVEFFECFFEAV